MTTKPKAQIMKQLSVIILIILSMSLFAQEHVVSQKAQGKSENSKPIAQNQDFMQNSKNLESETYPSGRQVWNQKLAKAYGDTIWYEDFDSTRWKQYGLGEGPEGWQFYDSTGNNFCWGWSSHGPRGRYTSPNGGPGALKEDLEPNEELLELLSEIGASCNNGVMMIESGFFNTGTDGQIVDNPIEMNSWFQTDYIDLSNYAAAQLSFYQIWRLCCGLYNNEISILASADYHLNHAEAHWEEFNGMANTTIANYTYLEDRHLTFDLSAFAGQDSIVIRFYKKGFSHYFWIIDDILISEPAAHNLVLERAWWDYAVYPNSISLTEDQEYWNDYEDVWNGGYTKIPVPQIQDFVSFRAAVKNIGYETQENVWLNVRVTRDNEEIFNENSLGIILEKEIQDTIFLETNFTP